MSTLIRRSARCSFLTLAGTALAFVGCWGNNDDLCPGVVKGATYEVEVHERRIHVTSTDCHLRWGFEPGVVLLATVNQTEPSGTCTVGVPDLSGVPDWSFETQPTEALADGFLLGYYKAKFRTCEAYMSLRLDESTALPCFQGSSDLSAECSLELNFNGGGKGCPDLCSTSLAVTVTRQ